MKKIIFALLFAATLISCTQNEGADTPGDSTVLLLGKWNLISDTYGTATKYDEMLTTCKQEYWQWDFKNSKEMIFRATSDDPSLALNQCNPKLNAYTYTIKNDLLVLTPVNSGYTGADGYIESVSNTTLVFKSRIDEYQKFRKFTFKRQLN